MSLLSSSEQPANGGLSVQGTPPVEETAPVEETSNVGLGAPTGELADREDDEYESNYDGEAKTVEQNFTYLTHTDQNRVGDISGGVYLDDVERIKAEVTRAKIEGREPDLENPPAIQSTPLVPTHVARNLAPGGHVIPVDVKLPVVIGVPKEED